MAHTADVVHSGGLRVGVAVGDGLGVGVRGRRVGTRSAWGTCVGVGDAVGLGDAVGVGDVVGVGLTVGVPAGEKVRSTQYTLEFQVLLGNALLAPYL